MRSLSEQKMKTVVLHGICPECSGMVEGSDEQTEAYLMTFTGVCQSCAIEYTVDHWADEMLSGHAWGDD